MRPYAQPERSYNLLEGPVEYSSRRRLMDIAAHRQAALAPIRQLA
jgi:hypothetical protein